MSDKQKIEQQSEKFVFTPENLLANIDKIGAWSAYGLATEALRHYFPDEYDEDGNCYYGSPREAELLSKIGCSTWQDAIIKYQKEVGYVAPDGFNTEVVNEY
jgi:hypothetical protein